MSKAKDYPFHQLALEKLSTIFGEAKANELIKLVLKEIHLTNIQTVDELFTFSQALEKYGPIEAAVGAMLGVKAILQGAKGNK